jgi:hypothetical protein
LPLLMGLLRRPVIGRQWFGLEFGISFRFFCLWRRHCFGCAYGVGFFLLPTVLGFSLYLRRWVFHFLLVYQRSPCAGEPVRIFVCEAV